MKYVGIDVHKRMCQAAVLDGSGELLDEIRFTNSTDSIEEFARRLTGFNDEVRAVVESTGNLWIQVHDRLEAKGFDVVFSSPANSRLISEAKMKTDETEARAFARLLWVDVLSICFVPDEEQRNLRELLRHRLRLVKTRTAVMNRVHSLLDKHGLRVPYPSKFSKKAITWMKELSLGLIDDVILRSDLAILETLDEQVELVEGRIAGIDVENPQVRLLMTRPESDTSPRCSSWPRSAQ